MSEKYYIPENPVYNPDIRKLKDTDPASATRTFNPLFGQMIENTAAVKAQTEETAAELKVSIKELVETADGLAEAKGQPGGLATLDEEGKIPPGQLPPMDYDQAGAAAAVQSQLESHAVNAVNPHHVTAAQLGLGNVNNTSDLNKPVSNATREAIDVIAAQTDEKIYNAVGERLEGLELEIKRQAETIDELGKSSDNHQKSITNTSQMIGWSLMDRFHSFDSNVMDLSFGKYAGASVSNIGKQLISWSNYKGEDLSFSYLVDLNTWDDLSSQMIGEINRSQAISDLVNNSPYVKTILSGDAPFAGENPYYFYMGDAPRGQTSIVATHTVKTTGTYKIRFGCIQSRAYDVGYIRVLKNGSTIHKVNLDKYNYLRAINTSIDYYLRDGDVLSLEVEAGSSSSRYIIVKHPYIGLFVSKDFNWPATVSAGSQPVVVSRASIKDLSGSMNTSTFYELCTLTAPRAGTYSLETNYYLYKTLSGALTWNVRILPSGGTSITHDVEAETSGVTKQGVFKNTLTLTEGQQVTISVRCNKNTTNSEIQSAVLAMLKCNAPAITY